MRDRPCRLTFRGVRGSVATPTPRNQRHGGETSCLEIGLAPTHRLIVDCGTGIRSVARQDGEATYDILLSHYHADHLSGLPLFQALHDERQRITFYGHRFEGLGVRELLEQAIAPPWWPVALTDTLATKGFVDLDSPPLTLGPLTITWSRLNHPQGVTAFRFERQGRSVAYVTDHERGDPEYDRRLVELARGADVLIHDAQYTQDEYEARHRGWGHSSWEHAVEAARESGAERLILFHHDPERADEDLDVIVERARSRFESTSAAREGEVLEI